MCNTVSVFIRLLSYFLMCHREHFVFNLISAISPVVFIAWFYIAQRSLRTHYGRTGHISCKWTAGSRSSIRLCSIPLVVCSLNRRLIISCCLFCFGDDSWDWCSKCLHPNAYNGGSKMVIFYYFLFPNNWNTFMIRWFPLSTV